VLAYVLIAIGSALGGMGRYFVSGVVTTLTGGTFPYGTMIVNITGCLVIGFFATLSGPDGRLLVGTPARQFVMIGMCGGYTTFSSFSDTLPDAGGRVDARGNERRRFGYPVPRVSIDRVCRRDGAQPGGVAMQIPRDAVLLRIFIGESERSDHKPLYEAIVLKARELQLGGATVLRGPMGFGRSSHLHSAKILRLSEDLPMIIEIVDSQAKIDAFLPVLDKMMGSGLITVEKVQVLQYGDGKSKN